MKPRFPLLLAGLCCLAFSVSGQTPKIKFGEVDATDLQSRTYATDSTAEAVVLSDVATSKFEFGPKGFALRTDRHTRIKILTKSGYDHATVRVPYYRLDGQNQEVLENLRVFTHNLENGQVKKDKLTKEAVFEDKKDDNWLEKRFTLPNVREGSIIEYSYSLVSDFWWQMRDWSFQRSIPTAWSEYRVVIPEYFYYKLNSGGYEQLAITEEKPGSQNFSLMVQGAGAFRKARPSWEFPKLDVSNLENPAEALALSCALRIGEGAQVAGGRMYLKPLLTEGEDENPFKQQQRRYPVDFAAPLNHNVTAIYTFPEGFAVEALPKNTAVTLPDGAGRFVYTVAASGNRLQATSRVAVNKTMFLPDEYPILKEFFDKIVAKHADQVVLKKQQVGIRLWNHLRCRCQ